MAVWDSVSRVRESWFGSWRERWERQKVNGTKLHIIEQRSKRVERSQKKYAATNLYV